MHRGYRAGVWPWSSVGCVCVRGSIGAIQWESSSFRVADMEAQYCTQYINININTNTGVSAG